MRKAAKAVLHKRELNVISGMMHRAPAANCPTSTEQMSFRLCMAVLAVVLFFAFCPISAEAGEWRDGTHLLKERAKRLAEQYGRETRSEADQRIRGIVAYVDVKPPQVGDEVTFFTPKTADDETPVKAVLRRIGTHCYVFVEKGRSIEDEKLDKVVSWFDNRTYPTNTSYFGSEWTPGVDGDKRITLFLVGGLEAADGYFNAEDEYTKEKCKTSNEREMLYLAIERMSDMDDFMGALVAHEFQHLIHWNHDPKELCWVDEGCAEFASSLYDQLPFTISYYLKNPDRCLLDWKDTSEWSNYGNAFLFIDYLVSHGAGNEEGRRALVRAIVDSKKQGVAGVTEALEKQGIKTPFAEFFRNFCAATFLNTSFHGDAEPYGFNVVLAKKLESVRENPVKPERVEGTVTETSGKDRVKMWSTKAFECKIAKNVQRVGISFRGKTFRDAAGSNAFDVAVAFIDRSGKSRPVVNWLKVSPAGVVLENACEAVLAVPSNAHDTLWLIVCNRGPESWNDDTSKAWPAVPFVWSVKNVVATATAIARSGGNTSSASHHATATDRRAIRALVETAASGKELPDLEPVIDAAKADLSSGCVDTLDDVESAIKAAPDTVKAKAVLAPLQKRIRELVRFEMLQNNRMDLAPYLR
ncbi:MAG: hypothetical protein HQM09_14480 [Candidatus Riflebacteria bacterium]|nr:hypothetical protein [Candidatus Riflebacteria bacterium]